MGLDMYLMKKVSNKYEEVGCWRKANQIHKWFVDNVQDGDNVPLRYPVTKAQLQRLLYAVNKVLEASELISGTVNRGWKINKDGIKPIEEQGHIIKDPSVAKKLLPTQSGFFFGPTDYDEYYYQNLLHTKELIEDVLADKAEDLYYEASW